MVSLKNGNVACVLLMVSVGYASAFTPPFFHPSASLSLLPNNRIPEGKSSNFLLLRSTKSGSLMKTTPSSETTVISHSYSLGITSLAVAVLMMLIDTATSTTSTNSSSSLPSLHVSVVALFGALCTIQAYNLSVIVEKSGRFTILKRGEQAMVENGLEIYTNNYFIGGRSSWKLEKIVNYDFFPSIQFPILIYFKETDTPEEKWKRPLVTKLDPRNNGMVHFFPAVCNCRELDAEFKRRRVPHHST